MAFRQPRAGNLDELAVFAQVVDVLRTAVAHAGADAANHLEDGVRQNSLIRHAAFNTFGDDRVCLIADSAMSCGLPDGQYSLGGQAITVKGPRATLTEHPDTIAGSNTCLYDCMKRAVLEMNVPLESAVRAASETPAKSIGVDNDYGSLAAGRYGNVILADKELNIKAVIQKGNRIV